MTHYEGERAGGNIFINFFNPKGNMIAIQEETGRTDDGSSDDCGKLYRSQKIGIKF